MKQRIWELDAARGLCLLLMIAFHFWYDLVYLFSLVPLRAPGFFRLITGWGAVPFFLISGTCATLGSRIARRGLLVLAGGLVISAVTLVLHRTGVAGPEIRIYFGILHCLGTCMLLWTLLRKLPDTWLLVLGIGILTLGFGLRYGFRAHIPWLIPIGVIPAGFASADYFPLAPNAGFFLVGAILGRRLYRNRRTLLPRVNAQHPIIRFFTFFGRHSLSVYLLHQPVLFVLIVLWTCLF